MTKLYPKLYKRTVTGSIQEWWVELDGNKYRSHSGKSGGKVVTSKWKEAEYTNEGRSNERTPEQQAIFEVEALYTKRLGLAYSETPDSVDSGSFFQPMLAKDLKKVKLDFDKNRYFSQPKFDGVRAIVTSDGVFSRSGKELPALAHISKAFETLFLHDPDLILDGEAYNHLFKDDFNQIISLVRQTKVTEEDLKKSKELVEFHWYDIVTDQSYSVRNDLMEDLYDFVDEDIVKLVETVEVCSEDQLYREYERYIQDGYEGQIIRVDGVSYENKRTKNLLKHKDFDETEFEIVSIEEGKGNRSGMAGYAVCKLDDNSGRTFRASIKGTHEYCVNLLDEKERCIGGTGTIQHFRRTPDNIPRFPVLKAIYEGKRDL